MCNGPCRWDATAGGTIFSRVWVGSRSTGVMLAPKPTVTKVGDQPFSMGPNRLGDSTDKTESPGLTSVTRLPAKHTHRMLPEMQTGHSHPNPTGR